MILTEKDFRVLEALDKHKITTQRQLADKADISLGKVNYVLKHLLEKGLVTFGNFRKNKNISHCAYLLTPKGIEQKSKLAVRFVIKRLHDYNTLREILMGRLTKIIHKGASRLVIVGPEIIQEFISTIVREQQVKIDIIDRYGTWQAVKGLDLNQFDMILISDDTMNSLKAISEATDIPIQKFISLW